MENKKVLLVDLDPQSSLSISLGRSQPDRIDTTLATLMGKVITDTAFETKEGILKHDEGVDLLPANIELSSIEVSLVNAMSRETILKQYLDAVKKDYDFILLDCMSSFVIVKDMSRFGRDYLKVGFYTEILFKEKGVRFIAINNGIDSNNKAESDFTPFLNIMNEWYARDTSRKIQSIFRARMEEGKRVSPSVPYGYYRNPKNKQELLVDKESSKVVKRIYQLVIEGYGVTQIADILTKDKVLVPSSLCSLALSRKRPQ